MPAWWIPYAVMAAGAAAKMYAQNEAAEDREQAMSRYLQRQDEIADDRTKLIMKNLEQYEPEKRQDRKQKIEDATRKAYETTLSNLSETNLGKIDSPAGDVSRSYTLARGKATKAAGDRASRVAALMSRMRAPKDLRFQEGMSTGQFASRGADLGALAASRGSTDKFLYNSVRPDPLLMTAGDLAIQGGAAYGLGQTYGGGSEKGLKVTMGGGGG